MGMWWDHLSMTLYNHQKYIQSSYNLNSYQNKCSKMIYTLHNHKFLQILLVSFFFSLTVAPSCYLNSRCSGNPNGTVETTFSECCNVLSGVAFTIGRQCRLCPATGISDKH